MTPEALRHGVGYILQVRMCALALRGRVSRLNARLMRTCTRMMF